MDKQEEQEAWKQYKQSHDVSIRNEILEQYIPLVKYVVGQILYSMGKRDSSLWDEYISVGTLGLHEAVEKFDPDRNVQFKTYAIQRIRGAILDEMRYNDPVPRSVRQKIRELEGATVRLHEREGRMPSDEEIALEMGISLESYDKIVSDVNETTFLSLEDPMYISSKGDESTYMDSVKLSDKHAPETQIEREEMVRILKLAIGELDEKEKKVLILKFYEELTLKEIARVLNVTESRVSQLNKKAVLRLRAKLMSTRKGFIEK